MNHLFIILVISFILQLIGIVVLRQINPTDEIGKEKVKQGLNAIITATVFQFFVIISQVYLIYFINRAGV